MAKHTLSSSSLPSSYNVAARRAWRLLRLALLWARKGSILKARLMAELRHGAKYLKSLNHHHHQHQNSMSMIRYGERELSFDDTPVIHLRMSRHSSLRFIIPCIKPDVVDFDYEFRDDDYSYDVGNYEQQEIQREQCEEQIVEEDEGIDERAEEFIAKFYQQMKLQRDISFQRRFNTPIQVL